MAARHPSVAGREDELRSLADAVRRLAALTVTNAAPAGETAEIAVSLSALADRLAATVPDPMPARFAHVDDAERPVHPDDASPFDVVHGPYNPLAAPVVLTFAPPAGAAGRATFGPAYEGPPGCVHGAILAGTFDMVLSTANALAGVAGPTVRLSVDYLRPTLLGVPCEFSASVVESKGRRTRTVGRLVQDGSVTVEAEGIFALLSRDEVIRLAGRPGSASSD